MSATPESIDAAGQQAKLRVLIVDDHDVVHWGFRLMLGNQPWVERCLSARTGPEAYALAERYKPDVALVDLFIGEESGPEICQQLRERSPSTNVLLISGAGRISPGAARTAGASGFIPKDWGAADIARAVRMVGLGMTVFQPQSDDDGARALAARARGPRPDGAGRHQSRDRRRTAPLSAHDPRAHLEPLPQARRAQPRGRRAACVAPRAHRVAPAYPPNGGVMTHPPGVVARCGAVPGTRGGKMHGCGWRAGRRCCSPGRACRWRGRGRAWRRRCPSCSPARRSSPARTASTRAGDATRYAQPAIFLSSLASFLDLEGASGAVAFAGHSLGELSALAAADALSWEDALELVVLRGALMDESGRSSGDGSMLALLRGTPEVAAEVAAAAGVWVANDNAPGQIVLAGARDALRHAAEIGRERGVRTLALDVTGAFHSPWMAEAQAPFREALDRVELHEPSVTVFSGLTAQPFDGRARPAGRGADRARALARDDGGARRARRAHLHRRRPRPGAREARHPQRRGRRRRSRSRSNVALTTDEHASAPRARHARARPGSSGSAARCPSGSSRTTRSRRRSASTTDWIVRRTGIRERRYADPHATLAELAAQAGTRRARGRRASTARRSTSCWSRAAARTR